jgi:hypothetical protein
MPHRNRPQLFACVMRRLAGACFVVVAAAGSGCGQAKAWSSRNTTAPRPATASQMAAAREAGRSSAKAAAITPGEIVTPEQALEESNRLAQLRIWCAIIGASDADLTWVPLQK